MIDDQIDSPDFSGDQYKNPVESFEFVGEWLDKVPNHTPNKKFIAISNGTLVD